MDDSDNLLQEGKNVDWNEIPFEPPKDILGGGGATRLHKEPGKSTSPQADTRGVSNHDEPARLAATRKQLGEIVNGTPTTDIINRPQIDTAPWGKTDPAPILTDIGKARISLEGLQTLAAHDERGNETIDKIGEVLSSEQLLFMLNDRDVAGINLNKEGKIEGIPTITTETDREAEIWQSKNGVLDAQRIDGVLLIIYNSAIAQPEGLPVLSEVERAGECDPFRNITYVDVSSTYSFLYEDYHPEWVLQTARHETRHALVSRQDAIFSQHSGQNQGRIIDQDHLRSTDTEGFKQLSYLDEVHSQYLDVIEGQIEGHASFRKVDSSFYSVEATGSHEEVASDTPDGKAAAKELFYGLQGMILLKRMSEQDTTVPSETINALVYATGAVLGTERSIISARDKIAQLWNLARANPAINNAFSSYIEEYKPPAIDNYPVVTEGLHTFLSKSS